MRHVTVFNPGMMLRFGGHVWTDVHPPLTMGGWGDNAPVLVFDDQGGGVMTVTEDIVPTLRSQQHGHPPLVLEETSVWSVEGNGLRPSHMGVGISDANAPMYTLNTTEVHAVMFEEL